MKRVKRQETVTDMKTYIKDLTGKLPGELDEQADDCTLPKLGEAARLILEAIKQERKIVVVGDYDVDGIMSVSMMDLMLVKLKADFMYIVPRRFSEGYGLSRKIVDRIPDGMLMVTVDNGIAAAEVIERASLRGIDTIVVDHHNPVGVLPSAMLIVDPKVDPEGWSYTDYCGAGLVFKLAQHLFLSDQDFLDMLSSMAGVATIADVVPLTGDNRRIVRRGLENLNRGNTPDGLSRLAYHMMGGEAYEADDVSFKLAPALNAPGRLYDDGAISVVRCILINRDTAEEMAIWIKGINEDRKNLTKKALDRAKAVGENIRFVYDPDISEGLCGIVAGRISDDSGLPAFVVTDSETPGVLKGSARAGRASQSVFSLLQAAAGSLISFGGHDAAAGFSLSKEEIDAAIASLDTAAGEAGTQAPDDVAYYDYDLEHSRLMEEYKDYCLSKPFGEGMKNPVIRVELPDGAYRVSFVGKTGDTVRIDTGNMKILGFFMKDEYNKAVEQKAGFLTFYASFGTNRFNGRAFPQMIIEEFEY